MMRISTMIKVLAVCALSVLLIGASVNAKEVAGAKALFYDPTASGTVEHSGTGSPGGGFTPSVTTSGGNSGSASPVSNYYDTLNPGVMYWIELVRPGGTLKRVSNDRVFRSGDRIRIHVTTNSDGYLHIMHSGSTGNAKVIPVSNAPRGEVKMGTDNTVPSNGGWLRFDNNPGEETIKLVFASVKSSSDVVSAMQKVSYEHSGNTTDQLFAIYNQYQGSSSMIRQVQSGSKDLIAEGANVSYDEPTEYGQNISRQNKQSQYRHQQQQRNTHAGIPMFNVNRAANFQVVPEVYNAPANYVVNRSGNKQVKEPVVVEISLNHHP